MENLNRLKVVLVEKGKTNKWLSEQLNVSPSTVSKWCTNTAQPDLETLIEISKMLEVSILDLLRKDIKWILKWKHIVPTITSLLFLIMICSVNQSWSGEVKH